MEKYTLILKKISWQIWILAILLCLGVFLRTYNFHDWLRFNADQSRDASIVSDVLEGQTPLPLLGPKAGGTNFRVGPIFYYFQIAGAKVFGNYPDKMAYPDLFFSILTILLLFFFLRKYFDIKTSLLLVAVFSVSFYAIKYSRFAWNPNSLPFWTLLFLYALHAVMSVKQEKRKVWSLVAGIAAGVSVQLHTLALLFVPIISVGTFGFLLYKRKNIWKHIFIFIVFALLLNAGQIISEIQTGGENTTAFFGGASIKEQKGSGVVTNVVKDGICFVESNVYILSSFDSSDTCELGSVKKGITLPIFLIGTIFFIGGFALTIRSFRREEDLDRKYFLGLFLSYIILAFLILIPLANEISMRFYLVMVFTPFVFLGFWLKYLSEIFPKKGNIIGVVGVSLLLMTNGIAVGKSFAENAASLTNSKAGMDNVLLKEVELSAAYILAHDNGAKTVAVTGDAKYLFKALKSMQYFTNKSGVKLIQKSKKTDPSLPVFLIENSKQTNKILQDNPGVSEYESFGRFTIFSLKNK